MADHAARFSAQPGDGYLGNRGNCAGITGGLKYHAGQMLCLLVMAGITGDYRADRCGVVDHASCRAVGAQVVFVTGGAVALGTAGRNRWGTGGCWGYRSTVIPVIKGHGGCICMAGSLPSFLIGYSGHYVAGA